jgi:polar amino acid transport system substrate-binding protein
MKHLKFYATVLLGLYILTMAFSNVTPVAPAQAKTNDALSTIIANKVLRVGADTTYAPFESLNATTSKPEGFDVDLASYIAYSIDPSVQANVITSQWDPIIPNLQSGQFDVIISAMTITAARAQQVNFTRWYYQSFQAILVPNANAKNILTTADLNKTGVNIGVQSGTTEAFYAENLTQATIHNYDNVQTAITAMASGQVDCVLGDYAVVAENAALGQNKVVATYSPEYFGIAVKIGETSLLNKLNSILDGLLGSNLDAPTYNANYTAMYTKWFNGAEPPTAQQTTLSISSNTSTSGSTPGFEFLSILAVGVLAIIVKKRRNI